MKKITSLMMMLVLCCVGAFAQATELTDKIVRIGKVQTEVVPGQWYFLHTPRNPNQNANDYATDEGDIQSFGGLVYDNGTNLKVSATADIDLLTSEEGASANNHMAKFVRFVAVSGEDDVYNIQFGTGKWMADAPGKETMNNNSYIAGLAGKYNFYPVKFNGTPNSKGRFGWNKFDMANRVDNNGAGNDVVFWEEGENLAGNEDITCEDESGIKGNRIWEIFAVDVVSEKDPYESAVESLVSVLDEIGAREGGLFVENLVNGVNVGEKYGNYRPEDVQAFLELHRTAAERMEEADGAGDYAVLKQYWPTPEDVKAFTEELRTAYQAIDANRISLNANDIADGYYTLRNPMGWYETLRDTVYYTEEEANIYNDENGFVEGDEGFVTTETIKVINETNVYAPVKGLYSNGNNVAWGTAQPNAKFLWKIEKKAGSDTKYRLINMDNNKTINGIPTSAAIEMVANDTATVFFEYRGEMELVVPGTPVADNQKDGSVVTYSIRNSHQGSETSKNCIHCGGHSAGAGKGGNAVGWAGDPEASRWYLTAIDEETAKEWMNGDEAKVRRMVTEANAIVEATPAQFEIAKDLRSTVFENDSVVVTADQFYSQYTTEDGQKIPEGKTVYDFLIDGNAGTHWHSRWEDKDQPWDKHYLQIHALETLDGMYAVKLTRRNGAEGDHITKLAVKGYVDAPTDETTFEEGQNLGTLTFTLNAKGETVTSSQVFDATGCNYLRFYSEATGVTAAGGGHSRGYWHAAGFNVFKAEQSTVHEKSQYKEREAIITRLQAAMDAWTAAEYSAEDGSLINDEAFNAAYKELKAAGEAWKAVFVNPAALREAIAAAPAENLFVVGNNPGQWKQGVVTPATAVNNAKAYDEAAQYTPAESENLIKAIADATANVYASANKVETGKWYRIKFPTEAMYDTYEWDKTGSKAVEHEKAGVTQYPELYGKTAAAGKGKDECVYFMNQTDDRGEFEDSVRCYSVEIANEFFNGNQIYFYNDEDAALLENGEDLFRFIEATDSSYIIQNKATGLFLRGGQPATLSNIPSYFYTKAIGAGANIITYTNVLGEKVQHRNLHGERSTNHLVCWEASSLGSNSGLLIEEVEPVSAEPATEYEHKLWPGTIYAYTFPTDVTIAADADAVAYGAEVVYAEEDTTVVLKEIEAATIKAGTPFLMIANLVGEYITPADRLAEIRAELAAEAGENTDEIGKQATAARDEEYTIVSMSHGMAVDTLQKGLGSLVGTFRDTPIKAGKGIIAENDHFKHTIVDATNWAYGAYIQCDLDPESTDVLGTLKIQIGDGIADSIDQVLGNVAKAGNIYTVDGKLVGKGNINAINNLPAGIYVINGVKVTKN